VRTILAGKNYGLKYLKKRMLLDLSLHFANFQTFLLAEYYHIRPKKLNQKLANLQDILDTHE
jgi:hypothetical protein